jgi:hypothetical protein
VVGAEGTEGNDAVRAPCLCLAEQKFQLAWFIATIPASGYVVALNPQVGVSRGVRELLQAMDRRRQPRKNDARLAPSVGNRAKRGMLLSVSGMGCLVWLLF